MIEIKFRVWDTNPEKECTGKQMMYIDPIISPTPQDSTINDIFKYSQKGGWVWMQYTGLKDKNGVEIYEGDVVNYVSDYGKEWNGFVEWCDYLAKFYIEAIVGDDEGNDDGDFDRDLEVIGNIYENHELISKNNK